MFHANTEELIVSRNLELAPPWISFLLDSMVCVECWHRWQLAMLNPSRSRLRQSTSMMFDIEKLAKQVNWLLNSSSLWIHHWVFKFHNHNGLQWPIHAETAWETTQNVQRIRIQLSLPNNTRAYLYVLSFTRLSIGSPVFEWYVFWYTWILYWFQTGAVWKKVACGTWAFLVINDDSG